MKFAKPEFQVGCMGPAIVSLAISLSAGVAMGAASDDDPVPPAPDVGAATAMSQRVPARGYRHRARNLAPVAPVAQVSRAQQPVTLVNSVAQKQARIDLEKRP